MSNEIDERRVTASRALTAEGPATLDAGLRVLLIGALVSGAYVLAATLGFRVAFAAEQVTTVWAPTGIAIATLLVAGLRLWPAIWIGAFVANTLSTAPVWTAAVVASGNTLEAVAAVWTLRRVADFDRALRRVRDVLAFVGIAAGVSTMISATIGVLTLCAAAVQPWAQFGRLWRDWWLGDALGALVVAPAILSLVQYPTWPRRERVRLLIAVLFGAAVTHLVFGPVFGPGRHPLEYIVFPVVIAAAVAGGPPATALVVLSAAITAIWNTVQGTGPFAGAPVHDSLILLQTFMGVLAATGLLLAAAVAERAESEYREQKAAQVLRDREQMLRLAQRAGGVATFEWDFRNQVAWCSPEFFSMFGLTGRDGVMTAAEWGEFVYADDRERMATHLARALAGAESAAADYRIVTADGELRWLTYSGHIENTRDGDRLLGTVIDITARKQAELEIEEAKNAAESASRLKDQFLATLSHELRTPLNAILGYARMLQTNALAGDKRQRAIEVIDRNAVALNQLVEDLLDMSRITTGRLRLDPAPVAVLEVLREAVESVRPAAEAKRLVLGLSADASAGSVAADAMRLQQVFWNLLSNAVKFTPEGGRVMVSLRPEASDVEIRIADTGVGIAPDFLPFVFEPFRQADARLNRGYGGLGLGLAISRQLVELHGGTIQAASEGTGLGTTFVIRLPRLADAARTPESPPASAL